MVKILNIKTDEKVRKENEKIDKQVKIFIRIHEKVSKREIFIIITKFWIAERTRLDQSDHYFLLKTILSLNPVPPQKTKTQSDAFLVEHRSEREQRGGQTQRPPQPCSVSRKLSSALVYISIVYVGFCSNVLIITVLGFCLRNKKNKKGVKLYSPRFRANHD